MAVTLSPVSITMYTVKAKFANIDFHEQELIKWVEPTKTVVRIGSNYGEKNHETYVPPVKAQPQSKRGRRKKIKVVKYRKRNGNGKYMNSQISFYVNSKFINGKIFKMKLFRTGTIQIPGVTSDNLEDIHFIINEVRLVLVDALGCDDDEIYLEKIQDKELLVTLKNYKWAIQDTKWIIDRDRMINSVQDIISGKTPDKKIEIESIKYRVVKYPGVLFAIRTKGYDNYACIRIFKSGKINLSLRKDIDNTIAEDIRDWTERFFNANINKFIYDSTIEADDSDSDSD